MSLENQVSQMVDPHEFARLVNAVHTDMYPRDFQVIDGSRGDNGNDGYVASQRRMLAIYCPIKPEQRRDADFRKKIDHDLGKAVFLRDRGSYEIAQWTFVTPRKLSDDVIAWMRQKGVETGIEVHHLEATFLAGQLQQRRHLLSEFPQLQQVQVQEKLDEILSHLSPKAGGHDDAQPAPVAPGRPDATAPVDGAARERLVHLSGGYPSAEGKSELKALIYSTIDPVAELDAIHLIMRWWAVQDDDLAELRAFAERGIARARQLRQNGSEAALQAQLAAFLESELTSIVVEHKLSMAMSRVVGLPLADEDAKRGAQIDALAKAFSAQSNVALDIMARGAPASDVSATLQIVGVCLGKVALVLRSTGSAAEADGYLSQCKQMLLAAKDASAQAADELGAANATFNLANQIRFHGNVPEALALAKSTQAIAQKHGDRMLDQKAAWLIESLMTGKVPEYEKGERREWPKT